MGLFPEIKIDKYNLHIYECKEWVRMTSNGIKWIEWKINSYYLIKHDNSLMARTWETYKLLGIVV